MSAIGPCWAPGTWRDDVWATGSWGIRVAPPPAPPSSEYPGGFARLPYSGPRGPAHVGTARSDRAKQFAKYLDDALLEPPSEKGLPAKKKKRRDVVTAIEALERVIEFPPARAATARRTASVGVVPLHTSAHVASLEATGGAASARVATPFEIGIVAIADAQGIDNPTDDELALIADHLYQLARG